MTPEQNLAVHNQVIAAACEQTVPESLLAADFRMEHHTCSMTDRSYRGADGWSDWNRDLFEEFCCDAHLDVETVLAVEEDLVVATVCLSGTGIHSRTPIEFRWTQVTWFCGGRATRAIGVSTPKEALLVARCDVAILDRPRHGAPREVRADRPPADGQPTRESAPCRPPARRRFRSGRLGLRPAGAEPPSASALLPGRLLWA